MQSRIKDIRAADANVLAVCVDSVDKNAKVVKDQKLEFPILTDPDLKATDAFDLRHKNASTHGGDIPRPAVFIIDRKGVVQWRMLTDNWRVRVRPEQVLKELAAVP